MTKKVILTTIIENGNSYGFIYTLSNDDADYVEKTIKSLMDYCENKQIKKEKEDMK